MGRERRPAEYRGTVRFGLVLTSVLLATACSTSEVDGSTPEPSAPASVTASPSPSAPVAPVARAYAVMTDAPGDTGVLLLGGQFGTPPGTALSDLWSFSPDRGWIELAHETGRGADAIAYDSDSKLVVLVEDSRTWTYDPADDECRVLKTRGHPRDVWGARIAYDAGSDRMVLFGGFDGSTLNDQTWALDLRVRRWTRMHPAVSPPPQNFHAMAYDPEADRVILFSGHGQQGTWAYDYDTDTWTDLSPKRSPVPLDYSAMVYDPVGKRMILFGGVTGSLEEPRGETWAFDFRRNAWTNLAPATAPSPRGWHSMAFDAETETIVLFSGGETRDTDQDDVWLFDPQADTWTQVA